MTIEDKDVVPIERYLGLRNTVDPSSFELGDLEAGVNVDITDAQKLRRRKGYGAALFSGSHHSMVEHGGLWLGVTGGALKRLFPDGTSQTLRSGLLGDRLAYAPVGPRVYYSDGLVTGCVDAAGHRAWGLVPPSRQPALAETGGSLPAGQYRVVVTYERDDGQESGTGASARITLANLAGIALTEIPVSDDPTVTRTNVYISPPDDDKLYLTLVLPAGTTETTYFHPRTGTAPLATQWLTAPFPASVLAVFNTRVYSADGPYLRYTEAYSPELMDPRRRFEMPEDITMIAPVRDGLFVGTRERTVFLPGDDPSKFTYDEQCAYGAIPGTLAYANAADIDPAASGLAAVFTTTEGIVAGLNGGIIKNMTRGRFSLPIQDRGAGAVRKHGGMAQYLAVLEGTEVAGNTAL